MQSVGRKKKRPSTQEASNDAILRAGVVRRKKNRTALEQFLSEPRVLWLTRHCKRRWTTYYDALKGWRLKLEKFEKSSEDIFDWRKGAPVRRNEGGDNIFDRQNDSVNVVGSFAEFFYAQAKNDLFGGEPWLAAEPENIKDDKLTQDISRHFSWKLRQADMRSSFSETLWITTILGTCFTKALWRVETDTWFEDSPALHDEDGKPVLTGSGEMIFHDDPITEDKDPDTGEVTRQYPEKDPSTTLDADGTKYTYKPVRETKARDTYRNVASYNLHYKDVAYDPTAPELDLYKTGFYHRFTRGLADIVNDYGLSDEDAARLYTSVRTKKTEATRRVEHRDEADVAPILDDEEEGRLPNVPIELVEGYDRLDIMGKGTPSAVYVVFSPELEMMLHVDFLSSITPDGELPIHSHTINRIPWRIVGRGYFEKLELPQRMVDECYNRIIYHDRKAANPITALDTSKMELETEEPDLQYDPDKAVNLKPNAKIDEAIQFKALPDMSNRTVAMMQTIIQMMQMRTGITSASQGDVSGVPEANTATGVKQLVTRAAIMLKQGIADFGVSFGKCLNYQAKVVYANQDADETFLYGDGQNAELVQLKAEDVRNLALRVRLLLSQTQNQSKLENAQAAIGIIQSYLNVPEQEKEAVRALFVQAIRALDFNDPDTIVRQPMMQLGDAIAMLPPDQQQQATQVLMAGSQALGMPPPALPQPQAPPVPQSAPGQPGPNPADAATPNPP